MKPSLLDALASLPLSERQAVYRELGSAAVAALSGAWNAIARPEQIAPGSSARAASDRADWSYWLYLAGRGAGKTRSGAEWACAQARTIQGSHGALVAGTAADARDTVVSYGHEQTEGASGILAIATDDFRPVYEPSKRLLTWPNGSTATLYSAEEPDRLRGPQHHWALCDELAAWKRAEETWDMLMMGLRLGAAPRVCITTTPRPVQVIKRLIADPKTVVSRGTTYDNRSNLSPEYFQSIIRRYEGTRLGRQELDAEVLDDAPGALWTLGTIERSRVTATPVGMVRVVVGVDPAVTSTASSDETGLVVAGIARCGCRGGSPELHGFVLDDLTGRYTPNEWAQKAVALLRRHSADRIVAEVNNGGDLVETNIRTVDRLVPYRAVRASRGKQTRAEPISALYEQGRIHHVGVFARLEDQMTTWDPSDPSSKSPDRVDALVWALTDLLLSGRNVSIEGGVTMPDFSRPSPWRS